MSGPNKRTRKDVEQELKGVKDLYKSGKITMQSYNYLTEKLLEEMKRLPNG